MPANRLQRRTSEIAQALLDVSIPTLMLSLVHMSGDPELIRGELRPAGLFLNEVQGYMSEEDKAAVRKIALDVITDYRDRGCPDPEPISAELLHEMMQWLVCEPVPDEYVPMVLEEMELDGRDARARPTLEQAARDRFPVVVIGCGESGLLAGIRLKEAGIPFTIIEKNAGVGGTWWQNTYPGARVDVGNHFYCYSFEPTDQWTHFFAEQPELQAYFQRVMDNHDIGRHVRWETEVTEAVWDDETATWTVMARDRTGATTTMSARAVISAVGQLNRPHLPAIRGQDRFAGPAFHSSEWDHSVDLRGKRVAMIGAGASGFQIAPAIADRSREADRVSAHGAMDVPEPELSRARRTWRAVGTAAPAVLRPLVPVPAVLAVLRQGTRRRARRPGLSRSAAGGQRGQRHRPDDVHGVDHPAKSAMIPNCWPRCCRTTRRPASARCRTTAAGCAPSSETTST